jgi:hypothetical protein
MQRLNLLVFLAGLLANGAILAGYAQDVLTLDATKQTMRPPRGRGPFPGSATPGHSDGFPIRLELQFTDTGNVQLQGPVLVDFVMTNIGAEQIKLPCSVALFQTLSFADVPDPDIGGTTILTLWITSDAFIDQYIKDVRTGQLFKSSIVGISAELDGGSRDPGSYCVLSQGKSLKVHAKAGTAFKAGTHSFTGHALLELNSHGTSKFEGSADSEPIAKTLF